MMPASFAHHASIFQGFTLAIVSFETPHGITFGQTPHQYICENLRNLWTKDKQQEESSADYADRLRLFSFPRALSCHRCSLLLYDFSKLEEFRFKRNMFDVSALWWIPCLSVMRSASRAIFFPAMAFVTTWRIMQPSEIGSDTKLKLSDTYRTPLHASTLLAFRWHPRNKKRLTHWE